jgi:hypothetical protein
MDYGVAVSGAANAVTQLAAVRLSGKIGISYSVIPTASAAGTVQLQVSDFDDLHTMQTPKQATTWVNSGTAQTITAGVPFNMMISSPWAKFFRLVITAGSGSSGSFSVAINLRAGYGS